MESGTGADSGGDGGKTRSDSIIIERTGSDHLRRRQGVILVRRTYRSGKSIVRAGDEGRDGRCRRRSRSGVSIRAEGQIEEMLSDCVETEREGSTVDR